MTERIRAIEDFVRAGWKVNLNFSPVVYEEWAADYIRLFEELSETLSPAAKVKAEDMLWAPRLQETKRSENSHENLRYRTALKARMVRMFLNLMAEHLPWCPVRYTF